MPSGRRTPERILHRIEFRVLRRLDGLLQGDHRTLAYGASLDFADLREYQVDDDVRRIDWNVTARLDEPYVRTYLEDREVTAWFVVDRSASMGFGVGGQTKAEAGVDFVTAMARLLTRRGNRVGALLYTDEVEAVIEPRGGRNQVLHLTERLLRPIAATSAPTDLGAALDAMASRLRRRSLVIVVSDFISCDGWERPLRMLASRHDVVAVRLLDPGERCLPDTGVIVVEDAETGEQVVVDTGDVEFRRRLEALDVAFDTELRRSLDRARVEHLTLSTDADLTQALVELSRRRRVRRR